MKIITVILFCMLIFYSCSNTDVKEPDFFNVFQITVGGPFSEAVIRNKLQIDTQANSSLKKVRLNDSANYLISISNPLKSPIYVLALNSIILNLEGYNAYHGREKGWFVSFFDHGAMPDTVSILPKSSEDFLLRLYDNPPMDSTRIVIKVIVDKTFKTEVFQCILLDNEMNIVSMDSCENVM